MKEIKRKPYIIGLIFYIASWIYALKVYSAPSQDFINLGPVAAVVIIITTTILFVLYNLLVFAYQKNRLQIALLLVFFLLIIAYLGWNKSI